MKISIAERLRPFHHCPGDPVPLPGSLLAIQAFPALIRITDLSDAIPRSIGEVALDVQGPVDDFTVLLDLERGWIQVWGFSQGGYFRYRLHAIEGGESVLLVVEKEPFRSLGWHCRGLLRLAEVASVPEGLPGGQARLLSWQGSQAAPTPIAFTPMPLERLSLGSHRKQDWTLVQRRCDMTEIFPIWFRLGQLIPQVVEGKSRTGTASLLTVCQHAIESGKPETIIPAFKTLYMSSLRGMMTPQLTDDLHQGISYDPVNDKDSISPMVILSEGSRLIRSLFVEVEGHAIRVMPCVPPEFHCGRFVGIECGALGILDIEWTKKKLRRLVFKAHGDGDVTFIFPRDLRRFRVRGTRQERGSWMVCGEPVPVKAGQSYLFDKFEQ